MKSHYHRPWRLWLLMLPVLLSPATGCIPEPGGIDRVSAGADAPPFHAELLMIATTYKQYGRVDDEAHWAPELCRMPNPSQVRFSQSESEETHGQKLYYLFAKDRQSYISMKDDVQIKPGQVIVKESWRPQETSRKLSDQTWEDAVHDSDSTTAGESSLTPGGSYYPYARRDGKTYHASEMAGLYIMFKTDNQTEATDDGWVYGTVTADGKTVTSAGRVQSCMDCHKDAPHDRLFGLRD